MNVELIAIGTELLLGWTVNTNTAFLSRRLAELGVDCYHHVTVGDNPARLAEAVRAALGRSDCVVTCGGLGPTVAGGGGWMKKPQRRGGLWRCW